MLTSFFRKSEPINFLIIIFLSVIFYVTYNFIGKYLAFDRLFLLRKFLFLLIYLLSLILINFILTKDRTQGYHSYVMFLFMIFCISKPDIFLSDFSILSGFFIILGVRNTFAMYNGKNLYKKIFNAFLCMGLASLFFPVSSLFLILPFFGIIFHSDGNYRYWLIFFVALTVVFILATCYQLVFYDHFFNLLTHYNKFDLLELEDILQLDFLIPFLFVLLFGLWFLLNNFTNTEHLTLNEKRNIYLLGYTFAVGIFVVLFSDYYIANSGLLFMIIPAALLGGKYFRHRTQLRLREILLLSLVFISISVGIIIKWGII